MDTADTADGAESPRPIELLILTGFLGSGKTTLLSAYLRTPHAADVAVIVNEIGEIDLDGAVLSATADKVPMALLSNGCVCCAAGSDLPGTIAMLIEERAGQGRPLARILLETTGLALPGPLLRSLGPLAGHLRAHIVSTFDLEHGPRTLDLAEAAAQLAAAQRIVCTRQDRVTAGTAAAARALLMRLNPLAEQVLHEDAAVRAEAALAPLPSGTHLPGSWAHATPGRMEAEAARDTGDGIHSDIRTALCRFTEPLAYDALCEWLDNLAGAAGERLLRIKGLVRVNGGRHPLLVQCVGTVFSPLVPMNAPDAPSFLVVITRGLPIAALRDVQPPLPFAIGGGAARTPLGRPLGAVLHDQSPTDDIGAKPAKSQSRPGAASISLRV